MPDDPYTDPVAGVLRNKLGLRTAEELQAAEREITHAALIFLKESPVPPSHDLGSVDPHKGNAVAEVANIAALGLRGVKFHPSLQAFAPDDPAFWPVFAACQEHGLLALFHTGTSGIGARQPGGQGIRIDYAHPLKLDAVAAAHPQLTVVAAHFGWPWHMDLIAVALHKTNVYIDISGWSPKRIPAEVVRELKGRLSGQFVWGSDFPFISPDRCLDELDELGLTSETLLRDNAARILNLPL